MSPDSAAFEPLPEADVTRLLAWLDARYGIDPTCFAGHRFWRRGRAVWVAAAGAAPPAGATCEALGLLALRKMPPEGRLTSVFLQRFGATARRNVVHLDEVDARRFLARERVTVATDAAGYQIVCAAGRVLGAGFARHGVLRSEIPKAWGAALASREDATSADAHASTENASTENASTETVSVDTPRG